MRTKETFDWKKEKANYRKIEKEEGVIMEEWRKEMKWWGKEGREGQVPTGYVIPKEKDTNKMRPIVSYAKHPWKVALNTTARIVAFLLKRIGLDNTVIWRTMDVKEIEKELNEWSRNHDKVSVLVGDI